MCVIRLRDCNFDKGAPNLCGHFSLCQTQRQNLGSMSAKTAVLTSWESHCSHRVRVRTVLEFGDDGAVVFVFVCVQGSRVRALRGCEQNGPDSTQRLEHV